MLWINNCGSRDLGCFCSTFPPTSDFLCPLQALSPFLFLSSLCSRGAIVSQHHTLRFKTKQNQQTTIHLFSRLLLRCPTMSQHNLGQIQPFEANPHPSLSLDKYDCDFELTAIWFEQPLTWKPCWCVHIYTEVGCCCFFSSPECWQSTSCHMEVPDARPVQLCPGLLHSDHSGCYFCAWLSPREEHQLICAMHTTSSTNTDTAGL